MHVQAPTCQHSTLRRVCTQTGLNSKCCKHHLSFSMVALQKATVVQPHQLIAAEVFTLEKGRLAEMWAYLAGHALGVERVAAGALVNVHLLHGRLLHLLWARVDSHKYAHVEVDAQRKHLHPPMPTHEPHLMNNGMAKDCSSLGFLVMLTRGHIGAAHCLTTS